VSIILYRVDERLIHGQVVVGWGAQLKPQRIVVVDDELAASSWEQDLYTLGLPNDLASEFRSVADARRQLASWRSGADRVFLLTRDIATMLRLAEGGVMSGEEVNLGGIHHAPGRRPVLPYLYLNEAELHDIGALASTGVQVSARDLPNGRRVEAGQLVPVERRA
jgi:PTS system mannose-specific IIB component/fructoselysine and glucoselysine-specific PTS system IIB component